MRSRYDRCGRIRKACLSAACTNPRQLVRRPALPVPRLPDACLPRRRQCLGDQDLGASSASPWVDYHVLVCSVAFSVAPFPQSSDQARVTGRPAGVGRTDWQRRSEALRHGDRGWLLCYHGVRVGQDLPDAPRSDADSRCTAPNKAHGELGRWHGNHEAQHLSDRIAQMTEVNRCLCNSTRKSPPAPRSRAAPWQESGPGSASGPGSTR